MHKPLFPIVIVLALAACGGSETSAGDAPAPAAAAQSGAADTRPMLHLSVTGESGTFMRGSIMDGTGVRVPSCMTALVVENRGDKPLMLFSADFTPTHAQTREALDVVLSLRAGVPYLAPDKPLAPGERGQPWKMNVVGASCEQVQYTLGPINCSVLGGVCAGASAEQTGLAGISPVSVAAARR